MAVYYLDATNGNDTTGNGSSATPWKTVSKAHTSATAGDTIIFKDSDDTYEWVNQTFSKALTLQGESMGGAVLDMGAAERKWTIATNLTLDKLVFQNRFSSVSWGSVAFEMTADSITVNVTNCVFQDIILGGRNGFAGHGLFAGDANHSGITFTFERNLIKPSVHSNNSSLGAGAFLFNFRGFSSSSFTFYHNTIAIGEETGEHRVQMIFYMASASSSSLVFRNNIIYSEESDAVELVDSFSSLGTIVFDHNCYYTTGSAFLDIPPAATNNITADPLFVDPDNGNYNLRPASPCIDTGVII